MMVRDRISGFAGYITGIVNYLTGCNQALLQPPMKLNGDFVESKWIDIERLEWLSETPSISLKASNPGSDRPAPRR